MHDRDLFLNIYGQVCTRCFGYGLDSTSLIPMADNLNHSSVDVTNELVSFDLQLEGDKNESYYRISKFLNDYTPLFKNKGMTDEEIEKQKMNIKGRFDRALYKQNCEALGTENIRLNLAVGNHIWNIPFLKDTYDEDNDSDDGSSSEEEEGEAIVIEDGQQKKQVTLKDKHGLEYFIQKEKEALANRAAKKRKDAKVSRDQMRKEYEDKLRGLLKGSKMDDQRILKLLANQSIEEEQFTDKLAA